MGQRHLWMAPKNKNQGMNEAAFFTIGQNLKSAVKKNSAFGQKPNIEKLLLRPNDLIFSHSLRKMLTMISTIFSTYIWNPIVSTREISDPKTCDKYDFFFTYT